MAVGNRDFSRIGREVFLPLELLTFLLDYVDFISFRISIAIQESMEAYLKLATIHENNNRGETDGVRE